MSHFYLLQETSVANLMPGSFHISFIWHHISQNRTATATLGYDLQSSKSRLVIVVLQATQSSQEEGDQS